MIHEPSKSKGLPAYLRNGAMLFTILLLLSCSQLSNSGQRGNSEEYDRSVLKERIASGDYTAVILIDEKREPSVYSSEGLDITSKHCGKIEEDGSITENKELPEDERCNLKGIDLLGIQSLQLYNIKQNPNCMLIRRGPYLVKVHAGGDNFPKGAFPCHAGH